MIYTENTKKAICLMFKYQKDQIGKDNLPYVFHPWHVAETMKDEERTIVAILHDVVEDTELTIEDIQNEGFSAEVINALKLLTHNENEDYYEYIERISTNPIAKDVKISDLTHNSDLTRLTEINAEDKERTKKYQKCLKYLQTH